MDMKLAMGNHPLHYLYEDFTILKEIVYSRHLAGGALHIVLDDHNVEDYHLKFCSEEIQKENGDTHWFKNVMLAIIAMLAELDIETRVKFVEDGLYD